MGSLQEKEGTKSHSFNANQGRRTGWIWRNLLPSGWLEKPEPALAPVFTGKMPRWELGANVLAKLMHVSAWMVVSRRGHEAPSTAVRRTLTVLDNVRKRYVVLAVSLIVLLPESTLFVRY